MNSFLGTVVIAVTLASAAPEVVKEGAVTVTRMLEPRRELRFEVLVPGPRDSVWDAFTTTAGLETWLWKDCIVDLRNGGEWTVNFGGGKTGGGRIERFRRGRDVTIHAMAPEWFPTVRTKGTTAKFEFEALGDTATRVRLRQTGWEKGAEWDSAYNYLAKGNAQLLGQLRYRFKNGPIDWDAVAKRQAERKP
jgi:uncharacterized protein YndB with AHSA1/START domain